MNARVQLVLGLAVSTMGFASACEPDSSCEQGQWRADVCISLDVRRLDGPLGGALASGDFDGDGRVDVVGTRGAAISGSAPYLVQAAILDHPAVAIRVGALDDDGRDDLVAVGDRRDELRLYLGSSSELLRSAGTVPFDAPILDFQVADLDADGHGDLVVALGDRMEVHWRTAEGQVEAITEFGPEGEADPAPPWARRVDVGDWDGDGRLDLLVVGDWQAWHFLGRGARRFEARGDAGLADPRRPWITGDFDRDGATELFGVFPVVAETGENIPTIRAMAWLDEDTQLWDHDFVLLDHRETEVAAGALWPGETLQLVTGQRDELAGTGRLTVDCLGEGSLSQCGTLLLPISPDHVAVVGDALVVIDERGGAWWVNWQR